MKSQNLLPLFLALFISANLLSQTVASWQMNNGKSEMPLAMVQLDASPPNSMAGTNIIVNGKEIEDQCGPEYQHLNQRYTQYLQKGNVLHVGESLVSNNRKYRFYIPDDKSAPVIEEITHSLCNDTPVIKVVKTIYTVPYFYQPAWVRPDKTNFRFQQDCNFGFDNTSDYHWNPTDGRDSNKGLLYKCTNAELTDDGRLVINGKDAELWASPAPSVKPDITKIDGKWKFGFGQPGDDFTSFTHQIKQFENKITRDNKGVSFNDKWWSIAQNTTDKPYTDGDYITYPPLSDGSMVFHPGPSANQNSKARFTAASDGTYTFKVSWKLVDAQGQKVSTEAYTNAKSKTSETYASILQQDLTNTTPEKTIYKEFPVEMKAGEWVSIEVGNGGNGFQNDSTLVEMSASKAN